MSLVLLSPSAISTSHVTGSSGIPIRPKFDKSESESELESCEKVTLTEELKISLFECFRRELNAGDSGGDGSGNADRKFMWLASQIIGADAKFDSPFGCRRITYADHTASGRFLGFVEQFLQKNVLPYYGNTHTVDSYVGLHTGKMVEQAGGYVKRQLGASRNDILLFCGTGCTAAIKRLQEVTGMAATSVIRPAVRASLPQSERWVVFLGPFEHHSNLLSWRESLAEVVEIGLDEFGLVDLKGLEAQLKSPKYEGRPKLGSFSACSNVTGIITDTRAIARLLHWYGAYACFDFACSAPYVNIDMKSGEPDGYDAIFLSPHKFIGGPGSSGILLMSQELYRIGTAPPSTSGGGTVLYVNADHKDTLYYQSVEEREDAGTPGIIQKIRAAIAFCVKDWAGHVAVQQKESCFVGQAMERIFSNPKVKLLGSEYRHSNAERLPVFSFLIYPEGTRGKNLHCRFVTMLLNDLFGIQARGGCACAGPYGHVLLGIDRAKAKSIKLSIEMGYEGLRPGWTRVSFAYYTPAEEMEFVIDAIEFIANYGRKFLSLYNFDWKTGNWDFCTDVENLQLLRGEIENFGNDYKGYMDFAKYIANSLPNDVSIEREVPEFLDKDSVNFIM